MLDLRVGKKDYLDEGDTKPFVVYVYEEDLIVDDSFWVASFVSKREAQKALENKNTRAKLESIILNKFTPMITDIENYAFDVLEKIQQLLQHEYGIESFIKYDNWEPDLIFSVIVDAQIINCYVGFEKDYYVTEDFEDDYPVEVCMNIGDVKTFRKHFWIEDNTNEKDVESLCITEFSDILNAYRNYVANTNFERIESYYHTYDDDPSPLRQFKPTILSEKIGKEFIVSIPYFTATKVRLSLHLENNRIKGVVSYKDKVYGVFYQDFNLRIYTIQEWESILESKISIIKKNNEKQS